MEENEDKKPPIIKPKTDIEHTNEAVIDKVIEKIEDAESVLVALSNDPSVDEIAAAIGLSMTLDSIGKHATAIYSGKTPNVLEFLNPSDKFETNTDSLQDFIIALNKDKADHLRYKIDGDFVKVYVTPYKTTITGDDLEFSRGDFNVDLVISLNVPAATELDAALREHGRIMHDATSVNVTNGAAGKFGDIEWVDTKASSICEMIAKLAFRLSDKMDEATATALLTGLVSATDRFSNPATTPDVMALAAKLMASGADQQLVVQNVQGEVKFDGEIKPKKDDTLNLGGETAADILGENEKKPEDDNSSLNVSHGEMKELPEKQAPTTTPAPLMDAPADEEVTSATVEAPQEKPAEESMAIAGENTVQPLPAQDSNNDAVASAMAEALNPTGNPQPIEGPAGQEEGAYVGGAVADQILNGIEKGSSNVGSADYGRMIDEALTEPLPGEGGIQVGANGPMGPQVDTQDVEKMEEAAALDMIHQAQAQADASAGIPQMNQSGELPKIVPTGGSVGYEPPMMASDGGMMGVQANPAMMQTPGMIVSDVSGVPDMNFQAGGAMNSMSGMNMGMNPGMNPGMNQGMGNDAFMNASSSVNPMPMPGTEMAPPPVLPAPDFGTMPPTDTGNVAPIENVVPVPEQPVPAPDVTVMPDMNAPLTAMNGAGGLPQMPKVADNVAGGQNSNLPFGQESIMGNLGNSGGGGGDSSSFKIPGIHT